MMYLIHFVAVLVFSFSMSVAEAQNKVVVIPLNSGKYIPGGVDTVTSVTGRVWMDRNLGSLRSALNKADPDAYGGLFQWGRLNDGHAWRNSTTIPTLSNTDVPGHDSFITVSTPPIDWRNPQNDNLWQGESGINNPCPAGFRLPTEAEWEIERASWSSNNAAGAFASPLKLVLAGQRFHNGSLYSEGIEGFYWSSTVDGNISSRYLYLSNGLAGMSFYIRGIGFSVRCIKD